MKKPKYVLTFGVPGGSCSTIIFNSAAQAASAASLALTRFHTLSTGLVSACLTQILCMPSARRKSVQGQAICAKGRLVTSFCEAAADMGAYRGAI